MIVKVVRGSLRTLTGLLMVLVAVLGSVSGCAGQATSEAAPLADYAYARYWPAHQTSRGVVLALHGFNDHSGAFASLATELATAGFHVHAPDQAGFGRSPDAGRWPGEARLVADLEAATAALRRRYPDQPLWLLGASMGGAVVVRTLAQAELDVRGVVLLAPALYGERSMPWLHRWSLDLVDGLAPALRLPTRVAQWLGYAPTDRPEVLARLRADPRVITAPRADTVMGLRRLMDRASRTAVTTTALLLYGMEDVLVPPRALCSWLQQTQLPAANDLLRMRVYPDGYHMLLRYSGGARVRAELLQWLQAPGAPGPWRDPSSAADRVCAARD